MSEKEPQWGSAIWFDNLYSEQKTDSSTAYFSYDKNGYQKFRHARLGTLIASQNTMFQADPVLIDVGCATGHLTLIISDVLGARNVSGVDFSQELLKAAKNNFPHIRFLLGGLPTLPLEDEVANVVSLVEVLYYVDKDKRPTSIAECARILKTDGILIFAANVQRHPYLTRNEVVKILSGNGFKIEKTFAESYGLAVLGEGMLMRAHRLFQRVLKHAVASNHKRRFLAKTLPYLQNPVGRIVARFGIAFIERLISYKKLFSFLALLNRVIPGNHASHLVVFARKA